MFEDEFGELFDNDESSGRNARSMDDVMEQLTHFIQEHAMPIADAIEGILNILRPGSTEASHDVMGPFRAAMFVQGFGEVANQCKAVWLTMFPWGLGFHFGFEKDYPLGAMSYEAKKAVVRSLCAVLQAGGMNAEMSGDRIKLLHDNGKEQNINEEQIVEQFRNEMDEELGPDAKRYDDPVTEAERDKIADWLKRWMPE